MSWFTFISSDYPLEEVENPYIKLLSVNEAMEKGIDLPGFAPFLSDIDRDKPGVVLWVEKEESLGEITIRPIDNASYVGSLPGNLKYCSALEWSYSDERAKQLIRYVRKHLELSNEIEIWHIWLNNNGMEMTVNKRDIHKNNLLPTDFKELLEYCDCEIQKCIMVSRS